MTTPQDDTTGLPDSREAFPFVAVTIQTTGIHPSTAHMVTIDAVTFNDAGETDQDFHAIINPNTDAGPRHQHGLSPQEVAEGQQFSKLLKPLDRLIDGRTLIIHDAPYTWGFIVSEARRVMTAAARQNRARGRGRNPNRRRRQKVGHVPTPTAIIDTLATARRQNAPVRDIRLAAVAAASGIATQGPQATSERAQQNEVETSRATTELLIALYRTQSDGPRAQFDAEALVPDRFGLQRSAVRVDATSAPRVHTNPGPYQPGKQLRRGMEFVVAPEITADPDEIIAAGVAAELNYAEKLTRETSVVVCNATTDLVGKAMHAHRKSIPLLSDAAFLAAIDRLKDTGGQGRKRSRNKRRRRKRNSGSSGQGNNAS